MKNHQYYINKTYELAKQSQHNGNHPFGSLLVNNNEIILTAENTVVTSGDITRHAELNLVSKATQKWTYEDLKSSTLYTSTEPCAMCSGAIYWSGISQVVFGCSAVELGTITTGSFITPCQHIFKYGNRVIDVTGPVLEEVGSHIHREFWQ